MQKTMTRLDALEEIYAARARLAALLDPLDPAQMAGRSLANGWTVKDLLAHFAYWERRAVELYQETLEGALPDRPQNDAELDAVNARILAASRACDLETVITGERAAYQALLRFVETVPEGDLLDPQRFAWLEGEPYAQWVLDNSAGHFDEHLPDLRAATIPR